MKRRELKKTINFLAGELAAECIAHVNYSKTSNLEDVDNVLKSILHMQNDMIQRLSHVEPGSTKLFFKKLRDDLISATDQIVEQIKALD